MDIKTWIQIRIESPVPSQYAADTMELLGMKDTDQIWNYYKRMHKHILKDGDLLVNIERLFCAAQFLRDNLDNGKVEAVETMQQNVIKYLCGKYKINLTGDK